MSKWFAVALVAFACIPPFGYADNKYMSQETIDERFKKCEEFKEEAIKEKGKAEAYSSVGNQSLALDVINTVPSLSNSYHLCQHAVHIEILEDRISFLELQMNHHHPSKNQKPLTEEEKTLYIK